MPKSLYFCATLNNYSQENINSLESMYNNEDFSYIIIGKEVGENGTPHLQIYLELNDRKRLSTLKNLFRKHGMMPHLECRNGSASQASEYCKKEGNFLEWGNISQTCQGKRNDLLAVKETVDSGANIYEVSQAHFQEYIRYERSISKYMSLVVKPRSFAPSVIVYWGRTRTGKSRAFWDNIPNLLDVWLYPGREWFDGYCGQSLALFDEFSGSSMSLTLLLKVLDRYPLQLPTKGGHTWFQPSEIYLTSNLDPRVWYPNAHSEHVDALWARFTNVVHFE